MRYLITGYKGQLGYDLSRELDKRGETDYKAIDIGHIDIEYELYLRKAKHTLKIPSKYVLEAGGIRNISNVTDINYYKQIVYKILN